MGRGLFGCLVPFFVLGGLLFGLGFAGAAFLVTALPGENAPSPLPFAAGAAGGLIVFWVLAFVFWRRAHPRRSRGLTASVDRQRVRRGAPLRAQLAHGDPSAELGLVCRVHFDASTPARSPRRCSSGPRPMSTSTRWSRSWRRGRVPR